MKKQNGITLVALVVTIIVLLILAGVSIAMVTGENGILARAQDTVETHRVSEEKELQDLDSLADFIENYTSSLGNKIPEEENTIEFGEITWNGETASVEIFTNSNYEIEYQVNGITELNGKWNKGTSVTGLKHGDTVYARLVDGTTVIGEYEHIDINLAGNHKFDGLDVVAITENSITINAVIAPATSEIGKFEFYINDSLSGTKNRTNNVDVDGNYTDENGNIVEFYNYDYTFTGLNSKSEYQIDIFAYDNAGNRLTTKKLVFSTK